MTRHPKVRHLAERASPDFLTFPLSSCRALVDVTRKEGEALVRRARATPPAARITAVAVRPGRVCVPGSAQTGRPQTSPTLSIRSHRFAYYLTELVTAQLTQRTATSPTIRRVLASNPRLREILRSIDTLRGEDRELALQEALGVGGSRTQALASLGHASPEDRDSLRQLAEAVEAAVRGGKQDTLGLDWGD